MLFDEMGDDTAIPKDRIPLCPHCGGEAFPWVRGYGNFLQGKKYNEEYQKASDYLASKIQAGKRILFLELGVGRMTPMFIQKPFLNLTLNLPNSFYITVNKEHAILITASNGLSIAEGYHIFADNDDFKNYFAISATSTEFQTLSAEFLRIFRKVSTSVTCVRFTNI